jgi:hypothetical protein
MAFKKTIQMSGLNIIVILLFLKCGEMGKISEKSGNVVIINISIF